MKSLGSPILGDELYSNAGAGRGAGGGVGGEEEMAATCKGGGAACAVQPPAVAPPGAGGQLLHRSAFAFTAPCCPPLRPALRQAKQPRRSAPTCTQPPCAWPCRARSHCRWLHSACSPPPPFLPRSHRTALLLFEHPPLPGLRSSLEETRGLGRLCHRGTASARRRADQGCQPARCRSSARPATAPGSKRPSCRQPCPSSCQPPWSRTWACGCPTASCWPRGPWPEAPTARPRGPWPEAPTAPAAALSEQSVAVAERGRDL